MQEYGNGRGTPVPFHALPGQIVPGGGKDQSRGPGVIHPGLGKLNGGGLFQVGAVGEPGGQAAEKAVEIGPAAVGVIGHQAPGQIVGQALPGRLVFVKPDQGGVQAGQGAYQTGPDEIQLVAVHRHQVIAMEQFRPRIGRQFFHVLNLDREAQGPGDIRQGLEFPRGHLAGGEKKQAMLPRGAGAGPGRQGAPQPKEQGQESRQVRGG